MFLHRFTTHFLFKPPTSWRPKLNALKTWVSGLISEGLKPESRSHAFGLGDTLIQGGRWKQLECFSCLLRHAFRRITCYSTCNIIIFNCYHWHFLPAMEFLGPHQGGVRYSHHLGERSDTVRAKGRGVGTEKWRHDQCRIQRCWPCDRQYEQTYNTPCQIANIRVP